MKYKSEPNSLGFYYKIHSYRTSKYLRFNVYRKRRYWFDSNLTGNSFLGDVRREKDENSTAFVCRVKGLAQEAVEAYTKDLIDRQEMTLVLAKDWTNIVGKMNKF